MNNRLLALIIGIVSIAISIVLFYQSGYQESFIVPILGVLLAAIGVIITSVSTSLLINRHVITVAIGVVLLVVGIFSVETSQSYYNAFIAIVGIYLSIIGLLMFIISLGLLTRDLTMKTQSILVVIGIACIIVALILSNAFPSYYQYGSPWSYYVVPTVSLVLGFIGVIMAVVPTCIISVLLLMQGQARPVAAGRKAPKQGNQT